jgi:hypothetical protein
VNSVEQCIHICIEESPSFSYAGLGINGNYGGEFGICTCAETLKSPESNMDDLYCDLGCDGVSDSNPQACGSWGALGATPGSAYLSIYAIIQVRLMLFLYDLMCSLTL